MKRFLPCAIALMLYYASIAVNAQAAEPVPIVQENRPLSRIMFGSCIRQENPVPIFHTLIKQNPELFIFLGDNIYADTEDMSVMRAKYAKLGADLGFRQLTKRCPILATWDDHDYGVNDGGSDYAKRIESQQIFVDFWKDPIQSPRRQRPGIYDAKLYGPEGKRVQVILLDTRYFRGPLKKGERQVGGPYWPSDDKSIPMLGETQWKWLEEQLQVPAELRIIASSIQALAESSGQETWSNLPHERQRLFDLLKQTKAEGTLIISGDRHWSELSVENSALDYPLYDLTSSSLNQVHPRGTPTINKFRISPTTYHLPNYGAIIIDWNQADPRISLQILDIEGKAQIDKTLKLSELSLGK